MVRVKVKCRDLVKNPEKRVMEMKDELFVISFKTEGFEQISEKTGKMEMMVVMMVMVIHIWMRMTYCLLKRKRRRVILPVLKMANPLILQIKGRK